MEWKMSIYIEQLREQAGLGGPGAALANELLVITEQHEQGLLSDDEYSFLVIDIADVRAEAEIANDEIACRFIINAAMALSQFA